jgi:hypothetical protein
MLSCFYLYLNFLNTNGTVAWQPERNKSRKWIKDSPKDGNLRQASISARSLGTKRQSLLSSCKPSKKQEARKTQEANNALEMFEDVKVRDDTDGKSWYGICEATLFGKALSKNKDFTQLYVSVVNWKFAVISLSVTLLTFIPPSTLLTSPSCRTFK